MIRTQVSLTSEEFHGLQRRAAQQGVSMASLVRQAVDAVLAGEPSESGRQRALKVVGTFSSGRAAVSVDHDAELDHIILT